MPFIPLNDIAIRTDYRAKEVDLIVFNDIIARIVAYLNVLKDNVNILGASTTKITVSEDAPVNPKINDLWFDL